MPTELNESLSGDGTELIFPDEATGRTYRLRELAVYDAEEVRDQMGGDVPRFGQWLPVTLMDRNEEPAWLTAPSDLRRRLVSEDLTEADTFTVTSLKKTGHKESDPYEAELSVDRDRPDDDQLS